LDKGIAQCQAVRDRVVEAPGKIRLSEAHWALGQNRAAERICSEALSLTAEINYPALQADTLQVLARIACSRGNLDLAESHLNQSQTIFEELGLEGLLANTMARLAHVAALGRKTTAAKRLAQEGIELCLARDYQAGSCEAHIALGFVIEEPTVALSHLVEAMNIAHAYAMIPYHLHALAYAGYILDSFQEKHTVQQAIALISQHKSSWHWTQQWLRDNNLTSDFLQTNLEIYEVTNQVQSILAVARLRVGSTMSFITV
jgi:tetratricopeptide (TPR) repeat protein